MMKTKLQFLRWLMMLMLLVSALGAWAQTDPSPTQTVCIGNEPYKIDASALPSPTYHWSITPGNATNWQINGTGTNITVDWKTSGNFSLSVYTSSNGCDGPATTVAVTVSPANTIALSSAVGTDGQTICINNPITNITYATLGATGATFSGLPAGVTGSWLANVITISGTPTVSGPFNYTVTLSGGCATVTATGTITVNALPATSPIYHN